MFALFSVIEYEGTIFHGVFETKKLAENAKKYMRESGYDTQSYRIQKVHINTVFCPSGVFDSYTFSTGECNVKK
jgi:hypothetical protein